jgi:hypothetical protein
VSALAIPLLSRRSKLIVHVSCAELLQELMKKERELGIYPDPEVDLFMKV